VGPPTAFKHFITDSEQSTVRERWKRTFKS